MTHRIREAFAAEGGMFSGPVEIDETDMGGKRKNMPKAKREGLTGRGAVGKAAIAGAKDRTTKRVSAAVIPATDGRILQGFAREHAEPGTKVYTDDARADRGMAGFDREAVNRSVGESVRAQAHANGIASFRAMLKRGRHGTLRRFSAAHMAALRQRVRGPARASGARHHRDHGEVRGRGDQAPLDQASADGEGRGMTARAPVAVPPMDTTPEELAQAALRYKPAQRESGPLKKDQPAEGHPSHNPLSLD